MTGWQMLFYKEVLRFWKVSFQTVGAPVLTAVLYLLIFGHVLQDHVKVYDRIDYISFLVPGLVMMSVLQNAFANSSSSLVQSKIMGSLVFQLLTPMSHRAWFVAYVGSSMLRGLEFVITLPQDTLGQFLPERTRKTLAANLGRSLLYPQNFYVPVSHVPN